MEIHTDEIYRLHINDAQMGLPIHAYYLRFAGSFQRDHKVIVKLTGTSNHMTMDGQEPAATWDEWGVFLARLFVADPSATCHNYDGAADFHWKTNGRFADPTTLPHDTHSLHRWTRSDEPGLSRCTYCSAGRRWSSVTETQQKIGALAS